MPKKTTLDDGASIYQKREPETEKKKWKELQGKDKLIYFKDYYLKATIITVIAATFVISLLYTILKPKPDTKLNVAVLNYTMDKEKKEDFLNDLNSALKIDTKKQKVSIDDTYLINQENMDQFSMTLQEKLTTLMYSKEIDAVICDEANFKQYNSMEYFDDLADQIPSDLYSKLSDSFYVVGNKTVGIRLSNCKRYQELGLAKNDDQILGIIVNSENKDYVVKLIKYLFDL